MVCFYAFGGMWMMNVCTNLNKEQKKKKNAENCTISSAFNLFAINVNNK